MVITIATVCITDLYDDRSIYLIAGGEHFFFYSLWHTDMSGNKTSPVDISMVEDIEFRFAPFSVIREKNVAVLRKRYTNGDITIIRDGSDGRENQIQVILPGRDTARLAGAFRGQLIITDSSGTPFTQFQNVIVLDQLIQPY